MRDIRRGWGAGFQASGVVAAALALAVPAARAEVVAREENGFVVRVASEVTAPPAEAWKRLLTPAQWWQSQHTFSGDSANLTLDPTVGGCFCEALPRPETMPPLQKGERWNGGVQHMRVVYLEPPRAMRLVGSLGPLQSEALAATMTITVKPTEKGSRILFEYVVGGFMRYKSEDIAPAVDRMLTAQLTSLASKLGPVAEPAAPSAAPAPSSAVVGPPAPDGELPAVEPAAKPVVSLPGAESYSLPPAGGKPAARPAPVSAPKLAPKPEAKPEPKLAPKPDTAPAPASAPAKAAAPSAPKPAPKPGYLPPAKPTPAKPAAKAPTKPSAKPGSKPAAKAPDPEADAHRDANAAFDALLSGPTAP
ncbi:SRPBCC domain-containing protein [Novosphingobium sp. PASSN1]|uniref:SRPBCC domain-containing protein n=1 Tax=Novosphingobium sp. PASSN1 TaxID=2015561 RepID=UPI000BD5E531|nr:SRPBCC domain-containing protein [Novosphingobium sp. PASSN1]OYU36007.1 MAG: hypothetical protein CFE35_06985 [Novosphingobium sp. PASSN1]